MRSPFLRIVSSFLFAVFLMGAMPKEMLHEVFYDHEDTIHPIYKKGEMVITKKHNHCSFLSFEFAPFLATEFRVFTFRKVTNHTTHFACYYEYLFTAPFSFTKLRGPPAPVVA